MLITIFEIYLIGVIVAGIVTDQIYRHSSGYRKYMYVALDMENTLEQEKDEKFQNLMSDLEADYYSREEMLQDMFRAFMTLNTILRSLLSWIGLFFTLITFLTYKLNNLKK